MILDGNYLQEYTVNIDVPQGSAIGPILFLLYFNSLSDDNICNIALYSDDTVTYCNNPVNLVLKRAKIRNNL